VADRTQIGIDIEATDKASDKIDDVADAAEKLDKLTPEVEVTADASAAVDDLKDVQTEAKTIDAATPTIKVDADTTAARRELDELDAASAASGKKLGDDVVEGSGKAKDAVHGFVGEAVVELPGVGDAVGPAGEAIGQMVEGLANGEIAMGDMLAAAAPLAALTVAFKFISGYFADIAATKAFHTDQVKGFVDLIKQGKDSAAILRDELEKTGEIKFVDDGDTKDALDAFEKVGLKFQDYVTLVNNPAAFQAFKDTTAEMQAQEDELTRIRGLGGTLTAEQKQQQEDLIEQLKTRHTITDTVEQKQTDLNKATDDATKKTGFYGDALDDSAASLESVKTSQDRVKQAVDDTKTAIDRLRDNLNVEQAALDFEEQINGAMWRAANGVAPTRQEILDLKQSIIDAGETAGKTDVEIQAEIKKIDDGNLAEVRADGEAWYKQYPVKIASQLSLPPLKRNPGNGILVEGDPGKPEGLGVGTTSVVVNMPRGSSGVDVVRQIQGHARRAGRLYGAPVVTRARR
jgi:hypothetical protein